VRQANARAPESGTWGSVDCGGIIRDGLKSAWGTGIEVTSERGGAAVLQGAEGFELLEIEARSIPVEEVLALNAEDVGHLHDGSSHFLYRRRER
jgi:hypothetical protein